MFLIRVVISVEVRVGLGWVELGLGKGWMGYVPIRSPDAMNPALMYRQSMNVSRALISSQRRLVSARRESWPSSQMIDARLLDSRSWERKGW